jgi:hypothetical protein
MPRLRRRGMFRRRRTPARTQTQPTRRVQQSPAKPTTKPTTKPTQSTATKPQAAATNTVDKSEVSTDASKPRPSEETAAKSKAEGILGNMFSSGGSLSKLTEGVKALTSAGKSFQFDDKERKRAESGLAALKKMAGKDGVLTPDDRGNIVGQMDSAIRGEKNRTVSSIANGKIQQAKNNRGPLRKALFPNAPLISKVGAKRKQQAMNDPQHMATARNQALGELNQGFKDMGMKTDAPVNLSQGRQNAQQMSPISLDETNSFKDTMLMVREKAKTMGLPEGKFQKGLPVAFLQDVLGGKPAASLLKHQVNPFGK